MQPISVEAFASMVMIVAIEKELWEKGTVKTIFARKERENAKCIIVAHRFVAGSATTGSKVCFT